MKELSGFNYFMVTAKLILSGFNFSYEIDNDTEEWINCTTGRKFIIKKSSDFISEEDLLTIIEQAGISVDSFIDI